ncbi:MAG: caspase family protein [Sphingomonadaceae bacterium]
MTRTKLTQLGAIALSATLTCSALAQSGAKSSVDRVKQDTLNAITAESSRIAQEIADAKAAKAAAALEEAARAERIRAALAAPVLSLPTRLAQERGGDPANAAPANASASNATASAAAAPAEAVPMASEQRLALVIGNAGYKTSPLTNPTNDARAMAIKLQQLGFTVIKRENASLEEMMTAVREFGNQLRNGGIGLFYYAGHGVQSRGINYLVPVDANIATEDELATRAYNANEVLEKMDSARNRINLVILDACRDNPFARSFRSGSRGLAGMESAPRGTLVAYATSPGSTASDGTGANGLYTEQLLAAMDEQGMKVEDIFKRVREGVQEHSAGKQTPWEMSSITGNFYFNPTAEQAALPVLGSTGARVASAAPRALNQVLLPRKLIENYQLAGNFAIPAPATVGGFSTSGEHFALATRDRALLLWQTGSNQPVLSEAGYGAAQLSANRRYLLGLADGRLSLTDLHNEGANRPLASLPKPVLAAGLSPSGHRLLIYTAAQGFQLYDTASLQLLARMEDVDGVPRFEFSPSGDRLVTWGSRDSNMKLWESERGTRISRLTDHWSPVSLVRFSRDGNYLISTANDDKAVLWRTSDGDSLRRFSFGEGNPLPQSAEILQDGKRVLAYVTRGAKPPLVGPLQLGVWDTNSGAQVATLLPEGVALRDYRFAPDRNRLYINGADNQLYVVDVATLKRLNTLVGAELLDFTPDGRRVIVRASEGVRLLDAATLSPLARMPGQVSAFVAQKGGLMLTSNAEGLLTLWHTEHGDPVSQLKGHLDAIATALFSDDGRRVLSVGTDNVAKLWALPEIRDINQLAKDQFESTVEYQKRMGGWTSPYSALVSLSSYNADAQTFSVRVGEVSMDVPLPREEAKKLVGQRQAVITGNLRFFDSEQLVLAEAKLARLP